jgi:hypothetical protein
MKSNISLASLGIALSFCITSIAFAQATEGPTNFNGSNSSQVINVTQNGSGFGIKASTPSSGGVGAVFGQATGTSGFNNGVWGRSFSPAGVAVRGENMAITGTATGGAFFSKSSHGLGLYGAATAANGTGVGMHGFAQSPNGVGVLGEVATSCGTSPTSACGAGAPIGVLGRINSTSQEGAAGVFEQDFNDGGGELIIGRTVQPGDAHQLLNVFRVDWNGAVFSNGGYNIGGADFAESFAVKGVKSAYTAGDVLVIDNNSKRRLARTATPYSTLVAGIYSTKPGVLASPYKMDQVPKSDVPLAVVGVVPCKVTAENGPIQAGDLLVTSSKKGYAMKGIDRNRMVGAVVGKALQPLAKGNGVIQVLVTLQ